MNSVQSKGIGGKVKPFIITSVKCKIEVTGGAHPFFFNKTMLIFTIFIVTSISNRNAASCMHALRFTTEVREDNCGNKICSKTFSSCFHVKLTIALPGRLGSLQLHQHCRDKAIKGR